MASPEVFAAFAYSRLVGLPEYGLETEPLAWVSDRLAAAGLTLRVDERTPPDQRLDGLPDLRSRWLDLTARVRVVDGDELRTLVLAFGASEFERAAAGSGAARIGAAFRDACDALRPTFGFLATVPVESVADFLTDLPDELHGLDLDRLATFDFPLWYVNGAGAAGIRTDRFAQPAPDLPSEHGVVFSAGRAW